MFHVMGTNDAEWKLIATRLSLIRFLISSWGRLFWSVDETMYAHVIVNTKENVEC